MLLKQKPSKHQKWIARLLLAFIPLEARVLLIQYL